MTKTRRISPIEARRQAGLRQEDLAEMIGVDGSYISHVEAGRRVPSLPIAQKYAAALGLTVDAIEWPSTSGK